MALSDEDVDQLSKATLNALTRVGAIIAAIGAIAAGLAVVLGLFFVKETAQQVAYATAILLAVSSAALFYFQRQRAARHQIREALEPLTPTASLRGLLPFEEGDELPGRRRDIQDLYTLIANTTFRFGVLWGEAGCGKTSLLRAGLVPTLRKNGFLPLYLPKPTKEPRDAIRAVWVKESTDGADQPDKDIKTLLRQTAPKVKKVVVIFDQFEEFFLINRTPRSRAGFNKWLGECVADDGLPVVFLLSIRDDFFAQLQNLGPAIPEPTSRSTTYQLQNFDTDQAKRIFSAAAKSDALPLEPTLVEAVVLNNQDIVRIGLLTTSFAL